MLYSPLYRSVAACKLDLEAFPFDTQSCIVEYLSTTEYVGTGIRFENPNIYLGPEVSPTSWQVRGTSIRKQERVFHGNGNKSVVTVTFFLKRYTSFFWVTAIIPCILIIVIALGALWLKDYATRLSLAVTAMLTIVAIVWSISSSIPVSKKTTWMEGLCRTSLIIITLICLQSTLSAVVARRTVRITAREKRLLGYVVTFNNLIVRLAMMSCSPLLVVQPEVELPNKTPLNDSNADISKIVPVDEDMEKDMVEDMEEDMDEEEGRRKRKGPNAYTALSADDPGDVSELLQIRREWRGYAGQLDFTAQLIMTALVVAVFIVYFA